MNTKLCSPVLYSLTPLSPRINTPPPRHPYKHTPLAINITLEDNANDNDNDNDSVVAMLVIIINIMIIIIIIIIIILLHYPSWASSRFTNSY